MGKSSSSSSSAFLRDPEGGMVSIGGSPVLEKTLDRKPRNCQGCDFGKWAKGDKLFILAGNQWFCPDCAISQGLPPEYYHRNAYATEAPPNGYTGKQQTIPPTPQKTRANDNQREQSGIGELLACMCYF